MRLLNAATFVSLLLLLVAFAIPYGTVEPWWVALFECVVFPLAAVWLIEGWLGKNWHVQGRSMFMPLVMLVAFAFIQTLPLQMTGSIPAGIGSAAGHTAVSASPYETGLFTLKFTALILTGALLLRYTSSLSRLRILVHVVIGIGVASAMFGILRQAMQTGSEAFILPYLEVSSSYGQFINRNHFAFLMEMVFGLTLGLIVSRGVHRDHALLYISAAVPLWTALLLSNSRGGIFSMICQLIFIALLHTATRPQRASRVRKDFDESQRLRRVRQIGKSLISRTLGITFLVCLMTAAIVWVGGDSLMTRLESASRDINLKGAQTLQGESRTELWRSSWELIKDYPVAGVGFGGYWVAISEYRNATGNLNPQQAHNDYLELLASGGIVGAAFGIWFIVAFINIARKKLRSADPFRRAACLGALTGLSGIAVHSFVDFGLHVTANSLVCVALIVISTVSVSDEAERSQHVTQSGELMKR